MEEREDGALAGAARNVVVVFQVSEEGVEARFAVWNGLDGGDGGRGLFGEREQGDGDEGFAGCRGGERQHGFAEGDELSAFVTLEEGAGREAVFGCGGAWVGDLQSERVALSGGFAHDCGGLGGGPGHGKGEEESEGERRFHELDGLPATRRCQRCGFYGSSEGRQRAFTKVGAGCPAY